MPPCLVEECQKKPCRILVLALAFLVVITACTPSSTKVSFDPQTCLEIIPTHVEGLEILSGPRGAQNIIRDMVPAVCNGHALFQHMEPREPDLKPGNVRFRVVVEYTGEVLDVAILDTTIASNDFLREVRDFIMDSDFTPWTRTDEDSTFIYPARFGS